MAKRAESESVSRHDAKEETPSVGTAGAEEKTSKSGLDATQPLAAPESVSECEAARLVELLDDYLAGLKAGRAPDRERLLADHPELAEPLQACLAGLEFIHSASDSHSVASPHTLGDFRIIREIGRGGMGAVFEAEQLSLGRRVAFKILRFGGVSDPEAILRFQREAETVARLHHTNIVPIFAVGCEQGVNYYAMQFIDGKSLDQVLRERTERGESIPPDTVAEWGLEAAEALAHAHARGVIHRDVKPSNLLIDEEGRIWLTDFGLAKRLDDVTLSMTGALLGTPRYMSPEQAAATHNPLDHRTDIYSLGASLYELATGQPVFHGDSPHNVISQILSAEPDPPRKHRPSLPRDLETILMKCLSKEAAHRYDSARQLVDDLRAFLDGRPIAARRMHVVERATRWVKRQRRSVALAGGAVVATLLLVTLGTAGGYAWHRSRLATLMLKSDNPPLVAELLRDGEQIVPPVTVPTQRRIEVPAGEYQLRLSSDSRLSQTFDMTMNPGQSFAHKLDLDDQVLWKDIQLQRSYRLAQFERRNATAVNAVASKEDVSLETHGLQAAVIELTDDGVRCLQGLTGTSRWELSLAEPTHEILKENVKLVWHWDRYGNSFGRGRGAFDSRPWVVSDPMGDAPWFEPTNNSAIGFDINGDGVSDMLLAARHQAWIIAVSGRDGEPLWIAARGDAADPNAPTWNPSGGSAVAYPPLLVDDHDGDGVADVVTTFIYKRDQHNGVNRWIELVSGSSGDTIWRYDLPAELFALTAGEDVPYDLQWFYGQSGGHSSSGSSHSARQHYQVRSPSRLERHGPYEYLPTEPHRFVRHPEPHSVVSPASTGSSTVLVPSTGTVGSDLVFVAGKHVVQLDLENGQPRAMPPHDMGVRTTVQPRFGDFDGDGRPDLLLVEILADRSTRQGRAPMRRLSAWSIATQSLLWHQDIQASGPHQEDFVTPLPDWPQVVDLNRNGISEIIVPDLSTHSDWYAPPWGRLAVLEGQTGLPRWHRQLFNADQQLDWFISGPDIDEDGIREIFVASQWGEDFRLFVDCLSGSDGRTLWRLEQPLLTSENESGFLRLAKLSWYEASGDGWPQLVVHAHRVSGDVADRVVLIAAGTGKLQHIAVGVTEAVPGDMDADGVDDLVLFQRADLHHLHNGGKLQVFRGVGRQAWRKMVQPQVMAGDLDGDGVGDLVNRESRAELQAYSGATGSEIWHTRIDSVYQNFRVNPATNHQVHHDLLVPTCDLNGDGAPDLLITPASTSFDGKQPLLAAVSGRDGSLLWKADFTAQIADEPFLLDCRDLDGDGEIEIVIAAATDYGLPERGRGMGTNDPRLWLAVLSGRNGQLHWAEPLTDTQSGGGGRQFELKRIWLEAAYGDLDHDGTLDLVLPAQRSVGSERLDMLAISGRDGHTLWRHPLPWFPSPREAFSNAVPAAVADLNGDRQPEVAVVAIDRSTDNQGNTADIIRLSVLRGATGDLLWQWQSPADRWGNDIDQSPKRVKNRLRPILVRRPDEKYWIALSYWNQGRELCVLDETGRLVSKSQREEGFDGFGRRLWTIDADGDGGDELVFLDNTRLALLPPEQLDQPIWTQTKAASNSARVAGVIPAESASGRIVVLGGNGDHSLRGFDPATGEIAWACVGPVGGNLPTTDNPAVLLNPPTAELPPHTLYQFGIQSLVRRGSRFADMPESWRSFARRPPILAPTEHDSRLLRPLPWKPADYEWKAIPGLVGWSAFYGITLAGVPLLFVGWMIHRRRWGMKTILTLPLVASIVLLAFLVRPEDREFHSPLNKLFFAYVAAGPVMFTFIAFAQWLRHGYWRRIVVLLSAAILVGVAIMALSLLVIEPGKSAVLQPGERYVWDAWYFMFMPVLYVMSWLLLIAVIGSWLVRTALRCRPQRTPRNITTGSRM